MIFYLSFEVQINFTSGYLSVLRTVLPGLLARWAWVGVVFGASCQAALVSDLLTALTLHIYCFYVYAARWVLELHMSHKLCKNVQRNESDATYFELTAALQSSILLEYFAFLFHSNICFVTICDFECSFLSKCIGDIWLIILCSFIQIIITRCHA